ncbi:ATP-binding protein [Paratractidigestivibacter sp.]|uniref:ATP-binding protein n=1 Tax=Paratractidigestivibacter sp. TaxID=2847316 RepID=UPI002ABDDC3B|nr:ATP-binding protein [Paratractidigestivibacter sp.]
MGELTVWLGTYSNATAGPLAQGSSTVITLFAVVAGIMLFSHRLPTRTNYAARLAAIVFACFCTPAVMTMLAPLASITITPAVGYVAMFVCYSLLLCVCVLVVRAVREASAWSAMFCATAGYTIQNLASGTMEFVARQLREVGVDPTQPGIYLPMYLLCICSVLLGAWWFLARHIDSDGLAHIDSHSLAFMMPVVCVCIIGFDVMIKAMDGAGVGIAFSVLLRLFHAMACVGTLWVEYQILFRSQLEHERQVTERLLAEHDRQLRLSRENIDAINVKCHDLRHQIRSLADGGAVVSGDALADLAREVRVYDSSVKTGNEALDTILTEKRLVCEGRDITLTCIADGEALAMMAPADIYSLFGNALDNAIEAVSALADPKRRSITLVVRRAMGCASVHVENFFDGEVREGPDKLPLTSKKDQVNHGFGTRSMQAVAQRYGGTFSAVADAGTFRLDLMLPLE